ncbi:MAG: hypothetical protein QOK08_2084, partial [Actinomycetota bacterium]|nr:hypothetical protein [Actinomycetota bacterium]
LERADGAGRLHASSLGSPADIRRGVPIRERLGLVSPEFPPERIRLLERVVE